MKKVVITGLLGLSSLVLHAGNMGPASTNMHTVPYIAGEGASCEFTDTASLPQLCFRKNAFYAPTGCHTI